MDVGAPVLRGLGYLGLTTDDLDGWRRLAVDLLGLQEAAGGGPDALRLRVDEWAWRIEVSASGERGVSHIGWETVDDVALDTVAERLAAIGADVVEAPTTAALRGVARLLVTEDSDGNRVEFFHTPSLASTPFESRRFTRFVTGDIGLGHIFATVGDEAAARRFWVEPLGMRASDTILLGGTLGHFFHVNARHHSFAFGAFPNRTPGISHLMLEVCDAKQVIDAFDRLVASGWPAATTLGKHTNDLMFSFYVPTLSGIDIEFGSDGRLIDDATWVPGHYDRASSWGHVRSGPRPRETARSGATP